MKMARCLFSLARPIMVVLITTEVVALAAVTTQTQSVGGRSSPSDSRQNGQSQRSEAQRIKRDAVRRLTKLIDEAKQIETTRWMTLPVLAEVTVLCKQSYTTYKQWEG
jgi:hypothetical protein